MNSDNDVKRPSDETDEPQPTRAENVVVSVRSVWAIVTAVIIVGGFVLRLSFQVGWLQEQMLSVNSKLNNIDRITTLESEVKVLKENGDGMKSLANEMSRIRHDFDVHVAETLPRPTK